jgi:hypothetical protein
MPVLREFLDYVKRGDEARVQQSVLSLSEKHRLLGPFALVVGSFVMLFAGLKLLVTNWRLLLIQILPAMWIWLGMLDFKAHVLRGNEFHVVRGPLLIPVWIGVVAITAACFYLNAVFAFAIGKGSTPEIRPAFSEARKHLHVILGWGAAVGVLLGFATTIVVRWGSFWFAIALGVVLAIMMVSYVALPARLIGLKPNPSRRDKLATSAIGGVVGAIVCSPPYAIARGGILLLGTKSLFVLGVILVSVGVALQAGATGAVKTIKLSASLMIGRDDHQTREDAEARRGAVVPPSGRERGPGGP